ncbi:hypothetical protein [Tabrizicola sp.]|uniref:hypothetical protein n=1 Tax=Tabrizicola sp. TaxID=2005166 RepID=UPI003F2A9332
MPAAKPKGLPSLRQRPDAIHGCAFLAKINLAGQQAPGFDDFLIAWLSRRLRIVEKGPSSGQMRLAAALCAGYQLEGCALRASISV